MRRSDIFESFVKIAEEKGLVAKSSPESCKEILEKTHRADSLSIDDIAKLYNVKPDAPKDAQYKRNIIERAHPDPVVIAPSYDKLNGLVENNNERQDILLHIVNKTNNGYLTNTKYAEKQLIMSLVRLGNDMDNRGQSDLVTLADACLHQVAAKPLKKKAQLQVIIPLVAAVLGGIYAKQHLRFHSDGFTKDYQKAVGELDDLLNSNSNFGVGYDYTPQFITMVNETKTKLAELNTAVQSILPQLDKIEAPHTGSELLKISREPDTHEALVALQEFKKTVNEVYPFLQQIVANFSNPGFKERAIQQKGFLSNIVDSTEILHGGKGLVADDFDDVVHALQTVFVDMGNIVKSLSGADSVQAAAQQQLTSSESSMPGGLAESAPAPTEENASPVASPRAQNPVLEDQTSQLEKELGNASWEDLAGNPG